LSFKQSKNFNNNQYNNIKPTMRAQLEVCAFTIQSCLIAQQQGAARVELCDNPLEGGTTPSYGTIKRVREKISIELFPIIRPRSMNYYYDEEEIAIIEDDIRACKIIGCNGVSIGAQTIAGTIDADLMKHFVKLAHPMQVTCNRAFDAVPNPVEALETLIACGVARVLTSGQAPTAPEGASLLRQLVLQANGRISIMPGAGIRAANILQLQQDTGAYEFHASARRAVTNPLHFINPNVTDAGNMYVADEKEVRQMADYLNNN
jgi:copper homeostasis protein